jgi:hypothetical protein
MIDATYFREQLARDLQAMGNRAVVELRLLGGHVHRVRSVVDVGDGHVTVERFPARGEEGNWEGDAWREQVMGAPAKEIERVIVPFESILDVILTPGRASSGARIGFG